MEITWTPQRKLTNLIQKHIEVDLNLTPARSTVYGPVINIMSDAGQMAEVQEGLRFGDIHQHLCRLSMFIVF